MSAAAKRLKVLIDLDVEAFFRMPGMPPTSGYLSPEKLEELALASMHKARFELSELPPVLRHASRLWLEERGLGRLTREPWPPLGQLPGSVEYRGHETLQPLPRLPH